MFSLPSLEQIAFILPGIVVGLTFHECAHGWMADRLGDRTARYSGRLTLNPLAHLDPIGAIMFLLAGFGWAKPVPVNPYNLRGDPKQSMLLVALAGPATNLILAIAATILYGAFAVLNIPYFGMIMQSIIWVNVVLAIFNLIPIPPLDGSKILAGILPGENRWLDQLEQYGIIILLVLVFSGAIGLIFDFFITPIVNILNSLAQAVFSIITFF